MGADIPDHRGTASGLARVSPNLQHHLADRAARLPHPSPVPAQAASNCCHRRVGFNPVSQKPQAVQLYLRAEDRNAFTVRIKRGQIGPLVTEILARASGLPDEARSRRMGAARLVAVGADTVFGPDGGRGTSIHLAGGLQLTLALTDEVIAAVQA